MTPPLRAAGHPSPIIANTHDDSLMPPAIPFDEAEGGKLRESCAELHALVPAGSSISASFDETIDLGEGAPAWLTTAARLIRPLSVGALMAIPTLGAASVGLVALIDERRGMAMARASVAFLAGLPIDIVLLIGTLATGYGVARTVEKLRRS